MKKLISLIAAMAIGVSCLPVFAANADKMEKALVSVKERITVPEEYSKFDSNINHDGDMESYSFTWQTESGDKNINVTAAEDGMITYYSTYDGTDTYSQKPQMSGMTTAEATAIAEDFVKTVNPDYPYEVEVQLPRSSDLYSSNRYFEIDIKINGVTLDGRGGSLTVNTNTGKVTDFNIFYEMGAVVDFESTDEFISREEARTAFGDKIGIELVYRSYYDDEKGNVYYPVYVSKSSYDNYINALTGEVESVNWNNRFFAADGAAVAEGSLMAKNSALTPAEMENIDKLNGLISKEDAEAVLRNNKILNMPGDAKTERIVLNKQFDDSYIYNASFTFGKKDEYNMIWACVDAETGEIINYHRSFADNDGDAVYQNDSDFKALAGDRAAEFVFNGEENQYQRYHNGIKVSYDTARIIYHKGTLTDYSIDYDKDATFPSIEGVMSESDALGAYLDAADYKVVCISNYDSETKQTHIVPVYKAEDVQINPFTGKAVDWRNEEITEQKDEKLSYNDISGHWAENYINALAEYNIGFEGKEFKPDENLTQADVMTLLEAIQGRGDIIIYLNNKAQADASYERALNRGIISEEERDDNATVNREMAAVYLIRAIGGEDYAKYEDIYVAPFNDVSTHKGYIALLSAMGIVKGDTDGNFNPDSSLTRAQFAVMIYNYLNR